MSGSSPTDAGAVLAAIRAQRPLVHCLTNEVTIGRVADALGAVGALPVMASAPEEAAEMVEQAQALVLNLGTPSAARWAAARAAGARARSIGVPVVLDPVGCGATAWRTSQARRLFDEVRATIVRGNGPEVAALAGLPPVAAGYKLRGVTAVPHTADPAAAGAGPQGDGLERRRQLAMQASRALGCTVVLTGRTDVVARSDQAWCRPADLPLLERVVGAGDVVTALIAAGRAVIADDVAASWSGLAIFGRAAHLAVEGAAGPGSFWPRLLDALSGLRGADLSDQPCDDGAHR
jgi:hydroxyethylthiazole kinase